MKWLTPTTTMILTMTTICGLIFLEMAPGAGAQTPAPECVVTRCANGVTVPDPTDCTKSMTCFSNGTIVSNQCPTGEKFDSTTSQCVDGPLAKCGTRCPPPPGPTPAPGPAPPPAK